MKPTSRFTPTLLVTIALTLIALGASAQSDPRMTLAESEFRSTLLANMNEAARRQGVSIVPDAIAYAAGDGGFVANTEIKGGSDFSAASLREGVDLLFVYVGAKDVAVPEGFYRVRLVGRTAQFIDGSGKIVAALAAHVEPGGGPAYKIKVKVKLTAKWTPNGPEVDIEIIFGEAAAMSSVSIEIPDL